ncbi:CvfB family protein [Bdellovibrio sp. BCCA]|uniref:CvfB family protein n=1 Tax=Bdellovibrio sp. BCCA TaxID=3136281 RepID=UPI0030F1697B
MIQIGRFNKLKVLKHVDFGVFLDGEDDGEILLPLRYMPEECEVGDTVDVFVMFDSDDRLMATTETPKAMVGDFALLKVVAVESVGAFLDWGLSKDLFLPYAEQIHTPKVGQDIIVYIYTDKSDRISASMRLDRHVDKSPVDLKEGQEVELLIAGKTDLGYKAIVNNKIWGVLYANEVFKPLKYGQRTPGYIKKIRTDGKIDLSLQKTDKVGHEAAEDVGPLILDLLQKKGGYLAINDKTPPETIYNLFGVSKKKYKIALGGLYKKRLITVDDDGIRLAK